MTASAIAPPAVDVATPADRLEVATVSADQLRASVRVDGRLTERSCPLLLGVVTTHVRAGRKHVRLDLRTAVIGEVSVVAHLQRAHLAVQELGGLLLFENVRPDDAATLRAAGLLVAPTG